MIENLNESSAAEALINKQILDQYRGQLVSLVCFTPLSFLLEQSTPVKATLQRFRLGTEADDVGFLEFPVAPIVATLRKGKPNVTKDFPVRDEDGRTIENEAGEACTLKITLKWEDEAFTFLSEGTEDASERARAMLASQVASLLLPFACPVLTFTMPPPGAACGHDGFTESNWKQRRRFCG